MIDFVDTTLRKSQNALTDSHPAADRLIDWCTQSYALSWIYARAAVANRRHEAPIRPADILHVDPQRIQQTLSWTRISPDRKSDEQPVIRRPKYRLSGRVVGGDWDRSAKPFESSTLWQSFVRHFEEGVPWAETAFYRDTLDAIDAGATLWDCSTAAAFDSRCQQLDSLYDDIGTVGYKTQNELHSGANTTKRHRDRRAIWGEIAVNVGRNGELLFSDGRNRLSMAKLHGLSSVPVVILVRHKGWQALRNEVARGTIAPSVLDDDVRTHPDIAPLI